LKIFLNKTTIIIISMNQKRGAFSLSVSAIVIVILASFLVVASFYLLFQFYDFGGEITEDSTIALQKEDEVYIPQELLDTQEQLNQQNQQNQPVITKDESDERIDNAINEELLSIQETPSLERNCADDLSCSYYFVFLPVGEWDSDAAFNVKVDERARFFIGVSKFKREKVGVILVPLSFVEECNIGFIDQKVAVHHKKIKTCADNYADSIGIDYERVIGLANTYDGGRAFFGSKVMIATLGFDLGGGRTTERPGIVAHELGHTYDLCDEYSFAIYKAQKRYIKGKGCENPFPEHCDKSIDDCQGNTPTYEDYNGNPVLNVCGGTIHYSIMGFSRGNECGLDRLGGYQAYGDLE
jgi:hypothetical protein